MSGLFDALFGGGAKPFGDSGFGPAWFRGFREPKDERQITDWRKRLASRIECNRFIIEKLRAKP